MWSWSKYHVSLKPSWSYVDVMMLMSHVIGPRKVLECGAFLRTEGVYFKMSSREASARSQHWLWTPSGTVSSKWFSTFWRERIFEPFIDLHPSESELQCLSDLAETLEMAKTEASPKSWQKKIGSSWDNKWTIPVPVCLEQNLLLSSSLSPWSHLPLIRYWTNQHLEQTKWSRWKVKQSNFCQFSQKLWLT